MPDKLSAALDAAIAAAEVFFGDRRLGTIRRAITAMRIPWREIGIQYGASPDWIQRIVSGKRTVTDATLTRLDTAVLKIARDQNEAEIEAAKYRIREALRHGKSNKPQKDRPRA